MKLLSKKQVDNQKKKEQEALFRQGQQMLRFVEEARLELNNVKAEKERELLRLEAYFDDRFRELSNKRLQLEWEVKELEKRKEQLS